MFKIILIIVLVCYLLSLSFILLYSIAQAYLAYIYTSSKGEKSPSPAWPAMPSVTVQLPVYNEMYVVARLIDSVAVLDYSAAFLQIQVLDDSTDETTGIIGERVAYWQSQGVNISHLHRMNRKGYKSGALKEGMDTATGDFIAIFDADFIPSKDFLLKTIPHFSDDSVGVVQTRWEHLNRNYSTLTRLQGFALDAHFRVEQMGRNLARCFINFNGTAGIWRKQCILDAGNWHDDTLTEDLDLSYRAQLKGWRFIYLEDVVSPAELPPVISALKSQQYRWNKGGAETAKKHLLTVLKARLSLKIKWQAFFHLLNSATFIAIFCSAICSIPLLHFKSMFPDVKNMYAWLSVFLVSFLIMIWIYYTVSRANTQSSRQAFLYFLKHFPLFLSVSMGLSLHNAIAVVEGYAGRRTSFVRTPKFDLQAGERLRNNKYLKKSVPLLVYLEALMALYFSYGIYYAFKYLEFSMLPFHLMLTFGFAIVCLYSIAEVFKTKLPANA